jgi:hypothetical protein
VYGRMWFLTTLLCSQKALVEHVQLKMDVGLHA